MFSLSLRARLPRQRLSLSFRCFGTFDKFDVFRQFRGLVTLVSSPSREFFLVFRKLRLGERQSERAEQFSSESLDVHGQLRYQKTSLRAVPPGK